MASILAILDLKGKPLIQRTYRDIVPPACVEQFIQLVLDTEDEGQHVLPCFTYRGINYIHVRHSNLYFLALSRGNPNAIEIIYFLYRFIEVLTEYFNVLEEESIRDNFVIIYELMDEILDFGHPQSTEGKVLQEFIFQTSNELRTQSQVQAPSTLTNAVSWRSEGIKYRQNEVFLDVIETVNMLVDSYGNAVRSEVLGAVNMKVYLSGMPELRLGLNDKVMFERTGKSAVGNSIDLEDVKFHQCVRLSKFENDRTISFIPPDGEFELLSYRLSSPVQPLIFVEAAVENRKTRIEYVVKLKSRFKKKSTANNVEVCVPIPEDVDTPKFRLSTGKAVYKPEMSAFIWQIKQLEGARDLVMRAEFGLPSISGNDERKRTRPINVKFEIPYFTISGIQVRYLKVVDKSGYNSIPWVRYLTRNGDDYNLRTVVQHAPLGHS